MIDLDKDETALLSWLGEETYSQYGECQGPVLDSLVAKGLVKIHGQSEHQENFIPVNGAGELYRAVSLTDAGKQVLIDIMTWQGGSHG